MKSASPCTLHDGPVQACARCGTFTCGTCMPKAFAWCAACLARPEARLQPSRDAKVALAMALVGLHGGFVLLPFAWLAARAELRAIAEGRAASAGEPWARGAQTVATVGLAVWITIAAYLVLR